jgi:hypothetical protein
MKRIFLSLFLLVSISVLSYGRVIAEGETFSPLGRFEVQFSDDPLMLSGNGLLTYIITYENSPLTVKVAVDKGKKCKNFVVISDKLAVQYTCNGEYFGVNLPDKKYAAMIPQSSTDNLNRFNYFHQKLITRGVSELSAICLIAVYFPQLLES